RFRPARRTAGRRRTHPRSAGRGRRGARASSDAAEPTPAEGGRLPERTTRGGGDRALPGEPVALRRDATGLPDRPRAVRRLAACPPARAGGRRRTRPERVRSGARAAAAEARSVVDRAQALVGPVVAAVRARPGACPGRSPDAEAAAPAAVGAEAGGGRRAAREPARRRRPRAAQPRAGRADLLRRPAQRRGGRPRPPRRRLRAGAPAGARQGRQGTHGAARRGGGVPAVALPPRGAAAARPRREQRALPLGAGATPRHQRPTAARAEPAPPAARVRDAPARGRRRPSRDPKAPGAQLALDDAYLQPRRRPPPAARLRPRAPALIDQRKSTTSMPSARAASRSAASPVATASPTSAAASRKQSAIDTGRRRRW